MLLKSNWQSLGVALQRALNAGLHLLYPEICQLCQNARATPADGFVCSSCQAEVQKIEPPFCECCGLPFEGAITTAFECHNCRDLKPQFIRARAAVVSRDKVLEVIHRYKYQRAFWFEPFLGGLLVAASKVPLAQERWDCIVPVPLHPTKQREREFNQAERLAAVLSRATGLALRTRAVRRVLPTRTQTQLTREQRLGNARPAFHIPPAGGRAGQ